MIMLCIMFFVQLENVTENHPENVHLFRTHSSHACWEHFAVFFMIFLSLSKTVFLVFTCYFKIQGRNNLIWTEVRDPTRQEHPTKHGDRAWTIY